MANEIVGNMRGKRASNATSEGNRRTLSRSRIDSRRMAVSTIVVVSEIKRRIEINCLLERDSLNLFLGAG